MKKCLLNKGDEETSERLRTKIFQLILERTNQRRLLEELKKKKKSLATELPYSNGKMGYKQAA